MARLKFTSPESVRKRYRERDVVIRAMGFPSYAAYLKSPEWKGIRREQLGDFPDCALCGGPASEVHHGSYSRAVLEGRIRKMLFSLCAPDHRLIEFDAWGRKRSPRAASKRLMDLVAAQLRS